MILYSAYRIIWDITAWERWPLTAHAAARR